MDLHKRFLARLKAEIDRGKDLPEDATIVMPRPIGGTGTLVPVAFVQRNAWPESLPLPLTVADALAAIHRDIEAMAREVASHVETIAEIFLPGQGKRPTGIRSAALARSVVVGLWPFPEPTATLARRLAGVERIATMEPPNLSEQKRQAWLVKRQTLTEQEKQDMLEFERLQGESLPGWFALSHIHRRAQKKEPGKALIPWPGEVAPAALARWARNGFNRLWPGSGDRMLAKVEGGNVLPWSHAIRIENAVLHVPIVGVAALFLAYQEVEQDRRRPICAVPANVEHHDLITGWKDGPWQGGPTRSYSTPEDEDDRIALFTHERMQLQLPFRELQNELVRVMREIHQAEGLRHWAAFLTLLSTDGGRQQWVRWTMDRHMEIMGYSKRTREDPDARARIAKLVELWTLWELARIDKQGLFRERKPLLHVGSKFDRLVESKWRLDGMELQINPLIYGGVRQSNGELGRDWCPAPVELAAIDHRLYPAALSLGLLLPIWWRWDLPRGRQLIRKAGTLLEQAGLPATRKAFHHAPGRTWEALERSLEELQRIGEVGNWEWLDNERELESRILLEPSNMVADRLLRGVEPVEPPIDTTPRTGRELRAWREAHGWTQVELAGRIGVVVRTLSAAETHPDSALTPRLVGKIRTCGLR